MREKAIKQLPDLTVLFLVCCVAGWIFEVIIELMQQHGFVNRGFLLGPWLPVYGVGGLLCLFFFGSLVQNRRFGRATPLAAFAASALLTTAVEFVTYFFLLYGFHVVMWDYTPHWGNWHGIISPLASTRFAIGCMLLLYAVWPLVRTVCARLSDQTRRSLAISIGAVLAADLAYSLFVRL